jgi:hypothetical protein
VRVLTGERTERERSVHVLWCKAKGADQKSDESVKGMFAHQIFLNKCQKLAKRSIFRKYRFGCNISLIQLRYNNIP